MDKKTYLEQLGTALRQKYPEPQVRDILSDYEDFFTSGAADGKSEAELCAEFGPPEQAARELKSENTGETARRGTEPFAIACSVLAIAFIAVFWVFHKVFYGPLPLPNAVDFWLAILFPLLLEGVIAIRFSQNTPVEKKLKWIPAVQIVLAVPVTAAFVWIIHFIKSITSFFTLEGGITGTVINATYLILLASIILFVLYVIYGHRRAHWFLFLDTTLLTLMLNFGLLGPQFEPGTFNAMGEITLCFQWAILPNFAAVGITWVILKIISVRKAAACRANSSNQSELS